MSPTQPTIPSDSTIFAPGISQTPPPNEGQSPMGPRHHRLKTTDPEFQSIVDGTQRATIRFDDRNFLPGDILTLHEWLQEGKSHEDNGYSYSGRTVTCRISHIQQLPGESPIVVLSLSNVGLLHIPDSQAPSLPPEEPSACCAERSAETPDAESL